MIEAFTGTERFALVQPIGQGGFGIVFEALDRERARPVALKVLRHGEGAPLYRFKREFRALADISHPNLVRLEELLTDGRHWFFTMELVRGEPLTSYVRPVVSGESTAAASPRQLDEQRLRGSFRQLADALHAIHDAGLVHCDLKPSNVLVTPEGRLVVLDFGLVAERHDIGTDEADDASGDLVVLGTPAYIAPERTRGERSTPAADWYSVGVMLYEALTGQPPFAGSDETVLDAKELATPVPPHRIDARTPRDLATLAMRLLDPDPERRPGRRTLLRVLGGHERRGGASELASPRERLIGRDRHLARLSTALETVRRGNTVVTLVTGASGIGKTALMRQFADDQQGEDPNLLVLWGRCYERETMPYKALDPLVDALAQHLQQLRDIEVARLLPRDVSILARVFPVLLGVDEVRRAPGLADDVLDSLVVRQRAAAALRELLLAISMPGRSHLLLVIDDAQWGDVDSAAILEQVLRPPDTPPMLLLVGARAEDAHEARLLRTLRQAQRDASAANLEELEVEALPFEDARLLAQRLTAPRPDLRDVEAIARESGGNPFFVNQLAQHAVATGRSTRLEGVLVERLSALGPASRALITAIAVSAQSIPPAVAAAAAGLASDERALLPELRAARLVRVRSDGASLDPYHDRIRETILSQLAADELVSWHRRLAVAWEQATATRAETLVTHYRAAGDSAKTRHYAVLAAERAQQALAFDRAAEFYELLVKLEPDAAQLGRWLVRLGDALVNAGRGFDAALVFLRALALTPEEQAVDLEGRAAAELIRAGYLDRANEVLQRLLPKVGVRPPGSEVEAIVRLVWYRLLLRMRGTKFSERQASEIAPDQLRRIDVLMTVAQPLALIALARGNALNMQASWLALRVGERRRVAAGIAGLAASSGMSGTRTQERALALAQQAKQLAEPLQDPWIAGRAMLAEGIILKVSGRWKEGAETLERAISVLSSATAVRWEVETAQTLKHDALYWMGAWRRLARELPARRQEAEQRGDLYSATHVAARLSPIVHMAADNLDDARAEAATGLARWTTRQFHLQHRWGVCTGVDLDLYDGDAAAAAARLTTAWPALRRITLLFQNGRIEMLFYRARVALALAAMRDADTHLRAAERDATRLERENAPWATALASLVRATIAKTRGQADAARTLLVTAESALESCHMAHYAAAARYRRGDLEGGSTGRLLMTEALERMHAEQIRNPVRLLNLLAPGSW